MIWLITVALLLVALMTVYVWPIPLAGKVAVCVVCVLGIIALWVGFPAGTGGKSGLGVGVDPPRISRALV